jgi:PAT family beta-lactamase induction signal transducer AmpG
VSLDLRRKVALVTVLYLVEGAPPGVFSNVWQARYLSDLGFSREAVGAVSAFSLCWSLKVLWSPLVDRFGDWRHWIAGALVAMAAVLAVFPHLPASALWVAIGAFCLASATQDIAIDAYSIPLTERGEEGPLNAARTSAYRLGRLAFGAGLPLLAASAGWATAHAAGAVVFAVAAAIVIAAPRPPLAPRVRRDWRGMLRSWRRPGLGPALGFLAFHRIGDLALAPMVGEFWKERGFGLAEFASLSTFGGVWAGIAGAVVGGVLVSRLALAPALWAGAALAIASNLGYAAAAVAVGSREAVVAAGLAESFCSGAAGVAFMALLVRACESSHAAVQYALLTALYPLSGALVGMASGFAVNRIGFSAYFAVTGLLALPSLALIAGAVRWAEGAEPRAESP